MEFNNFGQSEGTPGSRIAQELQHLKMSEDVCLRRSKFLEVPIKEKLQSRWLWLQFYKWRKKRWKWCVSFHFALNYLFIKQTDVNKLIDKQLESPWDACSFLMLIVTCSPRLAFDLEHLEVWQVPRFGGSKLGRKSWCGWRDDRRMAHGLTGQTLVSWIYGMELCHIKLKFVTNKMYLLRYRVAKPYEVLPLVLRSASLLAFTSHRARAQHLGVLWL